MHLRRRNIITCAWVIACCACIGGCKSPAKEKDPWVFFPAPPASPRVQFLTWASGADEVEPTKGSFEKFVLGDEPTVQRRINKPYGIAVHDGVVYVCDTKGLSLSKLDFKAKSFSAVGVSGPGRLRKPINLAIDSAGYKFIVDTVRKQVVVFSPADEYVTAFDVPEPCRPVDIAIHENELFVLDNDESTQIVVLDRSDGKVKRTFGAPGGNPGEFKIPNSIAISPDGFLFVSDTHNWRIQKLTLAGEPIWVKGTPGYRLGEFGRPRGIRVGPDGIVYVVDGATEIVQMFTSDGEVLMRFGGPGDSRGALGLPSTLAIDKESIPYFSQYVHKDFEVDYLLFVASQYGRRLVNVYAFGSFPPDYEFSTSDVGSVPRLPIEEGIGPVDDHGDTEGIDASKTTDESKSDESDE